MTQENSEKLRALYEVDEQPMYRIAYAVLHDQGLAEDAVSEAFLRLIGKLHKLSDCNSDRTKNYMIKVIKSTSINIYRRNKKRFNSEVAIDEAMQIADPNQCSERSETIDELLHSVKEPDKSIVIMRCVKEMSWKDVAEKLSLTESNVRKRFERTKKRLKGEISDEK